MHVTNDQISDKFNDGWKKYRNGQFILIYCDNMKSFLFRGVSCFNLLCMLLISSSRTSLITAEKNSIVFLLQWFIVITWKVFHLSCSNLLCMLLISSSRTNSITALHFTSIIWPCGRNNFKFNSGGRVMSSVLLFLLVDQITVIRNEMSV